MSIISVVSTHSVTGPRDGNQSPKMIMLFCGVGLVVSLCLMASGVDLSAGWV